MLNYKQVEQPEQLQVSSVTELVPPAFTPPNQNNTSSERQNNLYHADRLTAILQALPGGVVILDERGLIVQCNPAAEDMLGIPLCGLRWTEIIQRAFSPKMDDGHDISLNDGRIVNISTTPLGSQPGQVILLHDVTKTRQLQRAQQHQKRLAALGEMAAGLAHQIRTPLSSVVLYASHLKNASLDQTRRNKMTNRVISQVKHLETLVNDMLLFAKGSTLAKESFTLDELVGDLNQAAEESVLDTGISLCIERHLQQGWLLGNKTMLQSCVQNLMDNAIQAMAGEGKITLTVQAAAASSVDIILTDTGPGIPQPLQDKIFEPFYTSRAAGTGLGLSVVKLVAQAHQGDVWLQSTEGEGCRFGIRLPIYGKDLAQNSQQVV